MVTYTVFPVPGGTSLQPQDFYVQTYVLIPNANLIPRAPVWAPRFEPYYDVSLRFLTNPPLRAPVQAPFAQDDWPNPTAPFRIQQTWTWQYNLNLIGQDQLPLGKQVYDRPTLVVPPAQTWTWSYNLNLIGQDQLPTGKVITDRPVLYAVPSAPWYYQNLLTTVLAPVPRAPFAQYDWPVPRAPARLDYFFYNSFIGPVTSPLNQNLDLSLPLGPTFPTSLRTWLQALNPTLIAPPVALPPGENVTDRPVLAIAPAAFWYYQNLLTTSLAPPVTTGVTLRAPTYANPRGPEYHVQLRQWIGTTPPPTARAPFAQYDWPLARAPSQPAQSWTAWYNLNLIGKDALPIGKVSTDLPPRDYLRAQDLRTWIQSVNLALTVAPTVTVFRAPTYANPRGPDYSVQLRTWVQSVNLALAPAIALPFNQSDWPNPRSAAQPALGFTAFYNPNLIGQDRLPNRQQDWPLSSAHALSQIPLQIMVAGKPFFLVPPVPLPPGVQFSDRPQLRQGTSADLYTIAYSPLTEPFTPPPVSGVIPLRTLMGTGV